MGAFRYCGKCGASIKRPTPIEDIQSGQYCQSCGSLQPRAFSQDEWILMAANGLLELEQRVSNIDKKIAEIEERSDSLAVTVDKFTDIVNQLINALENAPRRKRTRK